MNVKFITGTLREVLDTFMIILRWILLKIRNVSEKFCRGNQHIYFTFHNLFPKIIPLWDNVEKYGKARHATDDNIIRSMRLNCRPNKATGTHSEYVIHTFFFATTMFTPTRLSVTVYTYAVCVVKQRKRISVCIFQSS